MRPEGESYDVALDIVFHSVKKVLLCVLRVACRGTTYWLRVTTDKTKIITARFRSEFSSAYGIGIVSYPDANVLTSTRITCIYLIRLRKPLKLNWDVGCSTQNLRRYMHVKHHP